MSHDREKQIEQIGRSAEPVMAGRTGSIELHFKAGRLLSWTVKLLGRRRGKEKQV